MTVLGTVQAADVKSCTQSQIEIVPQRVYCVSRAYHMMPFTVDDASRSEAEIAASEAKDIQTAHKRVGQDTRLDNRCIDLRAPAQNAIMRINSGVCDLWREACKVRILAPPQAPFSLILMSGQRICRDPYS